ncbi:MAG: hypothetical protein AAF515_16750 [Pseudomonadota bacterium]
MSGQPKEELCVASNEELTNPQYYQRLWQAVRDQNIHRRCWLDAIADALRDYEGAVYWTCRLEYDIPEIDETFGDDPEVRWLGYYLQADETGAAPKRISTKLERLRLLDLYFRIRHPNLAAGFIT